MKHVEAVAKQSAIPTPAAPSPRIRAHVAPRSCIAVTPSRNSAAKTDRQKTVVHASVATSRARSPPRLQKSAAAATRARPSPLPSPRRGEGEGAGSAAEAAVEDMPPVLGVLAHLAGPAPLLDGAGPRVRDQHLGALDLVERLIAGLVLDDDALLLAADRQRELLRLEARHGDHAGHREEVGHVLGVVDLVEERLLGGLHVHGGAEEIAGLDGHQRAPPCGVRGSDFSSISTKTNSCELAFFTSCSAPAPRK